MKIVNPNNQHSILSCATFNNNVSKYKRMNSTQDCKNAKKSLALFNAVKPIYRKDYEEMLLNNECKNVQ
ncbi:hypothetical protein [Empedobacter brevis]|uniref:hypothetical protein n=1 Tax=Empedobacter brevis TaxID=247 RepID=UPI0039B00DEA